MADDAGPARGVEEQLTSWKEIAAYLQRDVRTVRRWEATEGLPVHRHVHNRKSTVYAYPAELNEWRASRKPVVEAAERRTSRLLWIAVSAAILLIVAATSWGLLRRNTPAIASPPALPSRFFAAVTSEGHAPRWIPVAPHPRRLELDARSGTLYVLTDNGIQSVRDGNTVEVHDIWKGTAVSLAVAPDGGMLAVGTADNQVVLLTPGGEVLQTFPLPNRPASLVFSVDGSDLFVAAIFAGLKRIHVASRQMETIASMPGACPVGLALSKDGRRLYVNYQCNRAKPGHDDIEILDAATGRSLSLISGLANVGNTLSVSADGAHIWAHGGDACSATAYDHVGCPQFPAQVLNVIRIDDHRLAHTFAFPMQEDVSDIAFSPDGSRVLISGNPVRVIDRASLAIVEEYPLRSLGRPAFSPDGARLYLAANDKNALAVIDLAGDDCRPAPSGLVSWWPADGNANDVRNANHGTFHGGVTFAPGRTGQAFSFAGTGAISVPLLTNVFSNELPNFTVSGWFKAASAGGFPVFEMSDRSTGLVAWQLDAVSAGQLVFCESEEKLTCTAPLPGAPAIEPGRWVHFSAVHQADKIILAVNGRIAGEAPAKPHAFDGKQYSLTFGGARRNRNFFSGMFDELQVYNRALTAAEMQTLAETSPSGTCYR